MSTAAEYLLPYGTLIKRNGNTKCLLFKQLDKQASIQLNQLYTMHNSELTVLRMFDLRAVSRESSETGIFQRVVPETVQPPVFGKENP